jgi:hypothetical protein
MLSCMPAVAAGATDSIGDLRSMCALSSGVTRLVTACCYAGVLLVLIVEAILHTINGVLCIAGLCTGRKVLQNCSALQNGAAPGGAFAAVLHTLVTW